MLRPARDADRDTVLGWRNHPQVRAVSLTTHVITPEEHAAWWARALADPDRHVLVYEHAGRPAGVVTIDTGQHSWAFYLDVAGLGADLLPAWLRLERAAVEHAFGVLGMDRLGGETLADNTQVLALHRRFGFREVRRYTRDVDGVPRTVVWTERGRG